MRRDIPVKAHVRPVIGNARQGLDERRRIVPRRTHFQGLILRLFLPQDSMVQYSKSGSIAVIERFFRSLKDEMLRRLPIVPMTMAPMAREIDAYVVWYNEHRPHQGLGGRTPVEVRDGKGRAKRGPALETRPRYPLAPARGDPARPKQRKRPLKGQLVVRLDRVAGRVHLPIIELRHAA